MRICPYCENSSPDDSVFCEFCGKRLSASLDSGSPQKTEEATSQESTPNRRGKKRNWIKIIAIAVGAIVFVLICAQAGIEIKDHFDSFDVNTGRYRGYYKSEYYGLVAPQVSASDIEECIYLNKSNKTYSRIISNYISQGGYYQIKGSELTLQEYDGTTHKYRIDSGRYIVGSKNDTVTKVPKRAKFDAVIEDNNGHLIEFFMDGTATYDGKKASYKRDGYTIYITLEEDNVTLTDYVIGGYLCSDTFLSGLPSAYAMELAEYADVYYRQKYDINYKNGNVDRLKAYRFEKEYAIEVQKLIIHEY